MSKRKEPERRVFTEFEFMPTTPAEHPQEFELLKIEEKQVLSRGHWYRDSDQNPNVTRTVVHTFTRRELVKLMERSADALASDWREEY
jgi:hypothetical protein